MKVRIPCPFLYMKVRTSRPKAEKSPTLSSLSRTHHAINRQFYRLHIDLASILTKRKIAHDTSLSKEQQQPTSLNKNRVIINDKPQKLSSNFWGSHHILIHSHFVQISLSR